METSVRLLYLGGGKTNIEVLALYLSDIFLPGSAPGGPYDISRGTRTLHADRVLLGGMANALGAIGEPGTRRASYSNDATTPSCSLQPHNSRAARPYLVLQSRVRQDLTTLVAP